jgi:hypothetical protein
MSDGVEPARVLRVRLGRAMFGVYPAMRASSLDRVYALHY